MQSVFRIRDIFARIRICGSVPVTNGSGFKAFKNMAKHFCSQLFEGTFTSFFKDQKLQRSRKRVEINVFLTNFAWWWKDPDPYLLLTDPDPGGSKTYGSSGSGTLDAIHDYFSPIYMTAVPNFVNYLFVPSPLLRSHKQRNSLFFRQARTEIALSAHSWRIGTVEYIWSWAADPVGRTL